ncbi:MAG TPA: GTPase [Alphaproteobacteria bacterium]
MRLKSFYANTMTEAMHMVRDALGDDAIIVATREEGSRVRVTAAVDQIDSPDFESSPAPKLKHGVPDEYLQYDGENDAEDIIQETLTDTLLKHSVPSDISDTILSTASMLGASTPASAMKAALEHIYKFHPLPLKTPRKALMLIGAPGAGKTLATAKLAARATLSGLRASVLTTDTVRAGGVEQLEAFTKLLQIPLHKARSAKDLGTQLAHAHDSDLILVDTGGCNPFDVDDMRNLATLLDVGTTIEPVLVMAAGGDAEESGEIARCFAVLGVQRLMPTRLDVARRLGGLLCAAGRAQIAFSDASNTPMVANGLISLSAQSLTSLLMPPQRGKIRGANHNAPTSKPAAKPMRRTG